MKNLKKILSAILCVMLVASCFSLVACDLVSGKGNNGGNNGGGLTEDDWFDGDVFDDETNSGNTNDKTDNNPL